MRQHLDSVQQVPDDEQATLDGIEQLLRETRELLQLTDSDVQRQEHGGEDHFRQGMAA